MLSATAVTILTPEGPEVHSGADEEIELQRNRCEAAQALTVATELADHGDYAAAGGAILRCMARIEASNCARHELSRHLIGTLADAEGGLRDKTSYVQYGKQAATSYSLAHLQQRSNCSPCPRYVSNPSTHALAAALGPVSAPVAADEYNPYRKGMKKRMVKKFKDKGPK